MTNQPEHNRKELTKLEDFLREIVQDYRSKVAGLVNQTYAHDRAITTEALNTVDNHAILALELLFKSEKKALLDRVLEKMPEKKPGCPEKCRYGEKCKQVIDHNRAIDEVTKVILDIKERIC